MKEEELDNLTQQDVWLTTITLAGKQLDARHRFAVKSSPHMSCMCVAPFADFGMIRFCCRSAARCALACAPHCSAWQTCAISCSCAAPRRALTCGYCFGWSAVAVVRTGTGSLVAGLRACRQRSPGGDAASVAEAAELAVTFCYC
jgi:hypothetical protein